MGMNSITEFTTALGAGVRSNRYKVILVLPDGISGDLQTLSLMVQATTIPSVEVGVIEAMFKGQKTKLAGDYAAGGEWTVTVILEDGATAATAKKVVDQWVQLTKNEKDPQKYKSNATVEVFSANQDQHSILKYEIENIWVPNTGEISLSDESTDEVIKFDISFQYDDVKPLY